MPPRFLADFPGVFGQCMCPKTQAPNFLELSNKVLWQLFQQTGISQKPTFPPGSCPLWRFQDPALSLASISLPTSNTLYAYKFNIQLHSYLLINTLKTCYLLQNDLLIGISFSSFVRGILILAVKIYLNPITKNSTDRFLYSTNLSRTCWSRYVNKREKGKEREYINIWENVGM